jgi:microcystin-dependent protein
MAAIETIFVDVTSIVPASWFNRLQKHLAGFLNLKVEISGTTIVQIVAVSSDGVASAYIGGEMRRVDTTTGFTFTGEGANTYNVFVVATAAVDTFAVEVSTTVPATSPYRKVAEVDWSGSAITALRGVRSRVVGHAHDGVDTPKIEHNDLIGMASGDPHTMYSLPDGSRPFTGIVGGVDPSSATKLATKFYADTVLSNVPIGGMFWWPTVDAAPTGFLLADGAAVSRTTYDSLFAAIGETYGVGDGSTTFNIPDLRGRMIMGEGAGNDLGDTGGALEHTHSQPSHRHAQDVHSHTSPTHTHSGATTVTGGSHSHTQGGTSTSSSHSHTGPNHSHSASSLTIGNTSGDVVGVRHGGSGDAGLFPETDLDNTSSSTSHRHGDGSYKDGPTFVTGWSEYNSKSHTHSPAGFSYGHTHTGGSLSGSTGAKNVGTGNNSVQHNHTNPSTASGGSHTHGSGGSTGTASPSTNPSGAADTGWAGADTTGEATHPYLSMNALIRYG